MTFLEKYCEDAVSRKDVLDAIMSEPTEAHYPSWYADKVKALLSVRPEPCEDAVSRKYLLAEYDCQHKGAPGGARKILENAPSVMPKPRNGKWVRNEYGITSCSECGGTRRDNRIAYIGWCNKCGAKMEG